MKIDIYKISKDKPSVKLNVIWSRGNTGASPYAFKGQDNVGYFYDLATTGFSSHWRREKDQSSLIGWK